MNILINDTPETSIINFRTSKNLNYIESQKVSISQISQLNQMQVTNLVVAQDPEINRRTMVPDILSSN
jgi:hypothetical protein